MARAEAGRPGPHTHVRLPGMWYDAAPPKSRGDDRPEVPSLRAEPEAEPGPEAPVVGCIHPGTSIPLVSTQTFEASVTRSSPAWWAVGALASLRRSGVLLDGVFEQVGDGATVFLPKLQSQEPKENSGNATQHRPDR